MRMSTGRSDNADDSIGCCQLKMGFHSEHFNDHAHRESEHPWYLCIFFTDLFDFLVQSVPNGPMRGCITSKKPFTVHRFHRWAHMYNRARRVGIQQSLYLCRPHTFPVNSNRPLREECIRQPSGMDRHSPRAHLVPHVGGFLNVPIPAIIIRNCYYLQRTQRAYSRSSWHSFG